MEQYFKRYPQVAKFIEDGKALARERGTQTMWDCQGPSWPQGLKQEQREAAERIATRRFRAPRQTSSRPR